MKQGTPTGFTLLEVLVAFVIAALGAGWFLYVLSHTYYTTAHLLERLHVFDATTPLRVHLLTELASGKFSPEELETLRDDQEALSSYTILSPGDIELDVSFKTLEASFEPGTVETTDLKKWNLIVSGQKPKARLFWTFYTPGEER